MDNSTLNEVQEQSGNDSIKDNEYSLYEYLKKTPSVLIAGVSAIIAMTTFLARLITNIDVRKTFIFWNIDFSNINMDNSSLLFQGLISVFYVILITFVVICIDSISKDYVPVKRCKFANKCIKRKFKKDKDTTEYKDYIKSYRELRKMLNVIHYLKMTGVFILNFVGTSLFIFYSSSSNREHLKMVMAVCSITQFLVILVLSKRKSYRIDRKEIKSDCNKGNYRKYIVYQNLNLSNDDKSIRKFFTNKNLISVTVPIIIFCITFCMCSMFLPIKNVYSGNMQIVSLNDQEYVVVYQDSEKFFLKEIEVVIDEGNGKQTLVVHTDKQVILTSDSIDMEIRKYDDIKVLDIGEVYK